MEGNEYGRVWDLISDRDGTRASADVVDSSTRSGHGNTPTTASSKARSLRSEKKRKNNETDAHIPYKRGLTLRTMLRPLIMQALPTEEPGMVPSEIAASLQNSSQLARSMDSETLGTHIRIILRKDLDMDRVSRVPAKGPNSGRSHRYTRHENLENHGNANLDGGVSGLSADEAPGSCEGTEQSNHTPVGRSTALRRRSSEVSHVARDFRRHTTAESTAKTSCLDHSFNKLVAQAEQDGTSSITNFTSETHIWTPEHHDIVDKILATKILIAQSKKITGEIASLESQQALARSQYSNLDGAAKEQEVARANLLTEAQTWREQADEAERQASCHQRNAGKLKEEAENQRAVLEESTFRLNTAREESVRLAKGVRNTMEEALGGDLVELLSLHTHDAS